MRALANWRNLFSLRSSKKSEKVSEPDLYDDLEVLPVWNWNRVHETGDLKYLLLDERQEVPASAHRVWLKLNQQYMNLFGITKKYKDYLRLKKEIALLEMDAFLKNNKTLNLFADVKREKMRELFEAGDNVTFTESVGAVERYMGFQVDVRTTSVAKFYTYLKMIKGNGR